MSLIKISNQVLGYLRFHLKESEEIQTKIRFDFEKYDEDKDLILSEIEIENFIEDKIFKSSKNLYQYDLNEEKTLKLLKECDADNDGNLSEIDFCDFWVYLHIRSGEILNRKIKENKGIFMGKFSDYDLDKSGYLENEELEGFFTNFNDNIQSDFYKFKNISDFLDIYDLDKDGKLSFEEFLEAMFEFNMIVYVNRF